MSPPLFSFVPCKSKTKYRRPWLLVGRQPTALQQQLQDSSGPSLVRSKRWAPISSRQEEQPGNIITPVYIDLHTQNTHNTQNPQHKTHTTQDNDTTNNTTQRNTTQRNTTQHRTFKPGVPFHKYSLSPDASCTHLASDVDSSRGEGLRQRARINAEVPRRRVKRLRACLIHLSTSTPTTSTRPIDATTRQKRQQQNSVAKNAKYEEKCN